MAYPWDRLSLYDQWGSHHQDPSDQQLCLRLVLDTVTLIWISLCRAITYLLVIACGP